MRTTSRISFTACGAAAVTLLAFQVHPSEAQSSKGPTEVGCYDIASGTIDFTRHVAYTYTSVTPTFTHSADLSEPTTHEHKLSAVPTYTRAFTDQADVVVVAKTGNTAGADCSAVTYRLRIYDEAHVLVADLAVPGGSSDEITWRTAFDYPTSPDGLARAAYFSGTTETSSGRVVDLAPDDVNGLLATIDDGGATSSFK